MKPFGPPAGQGYGVPPVCVHIVLLDQSPLELLVYSGISFGISASVPAVYSPLILFVPAGKEKVIILVASSTLSVPGPDAALLQLVPGTINRDAT